MTHSATYAPPVSSAPSGGWRTMLNCEPCLFRRCITIWRSAQRVRVAALPPALHGWAGAGSWDAGGCRLRLHALGVHGGQPAACNVS